MEHRVVDHDGGTLSLVQLIAEHGEALEYDLISLGLRLRDAGSAEFDWRDLLVIAKRSPRTSQLYMELNPEDDTTWGVAEYILANVADSMALRLWQAGGGKGSRPKPVPRPGDEKKKQKHYGGEAETVDDILAWLDDEMADMVTADPRRDRARAIKTDLAAGHSRARVAAHYDVSLSTVGRIARGELWGDVTTESGAMRPAK